MSKITPINARNKLVRCFIDMNKKSVKQRTKGRGGKVCDMDIERQLTDYVKKAFELVGEDFSNPRKESFPKVMALLRHRCAAKANEKDVMQHIHKMMAMVKKIDGGKGIGV